MKEFATLKTPVIIEQLLNRLALEKWKVSEREVESLNTYTRFYFDNIDVDEPILAWTATHNGYGPDIAYVESLNTVQILYEDIEGLRILVHKSLDGLSLEELLVDAREAQRLGYELNHRDIVVLNTLPLDIQSVCI